MMIELNIEQDTSTLCQSADKEKKKKKIDKETKPSTKMQDVTFVKTYIDHNRTAALVSK